MQAGCIQDVEELEDLLSKPTAGVNQTIANLDGDFILLGVGGKMGPTLARMIRRALLASGRRNVRVIGVSRFSGAAGRALQHELRKHGVEPLVADLLNQADLDALPDARNVIYMAGMKFGATGNESLTWAMNTYLPGMVAQRYRASRIVAFSTGNVYGLVPVTSGGSRETDKPNPVGEYAMSCLGRERILEHFSRTLNIPMALIRLNYAVEMRYGVLLDVAQKVFAGQPIDMSMGHTNVIWQGDANAMTLQAFAKVSTPPFLLNVAGPEVLRVRDVAARFGEAFGKEPQLTGAEAADALLNDGTMGRQLFGPPTVGVEQVIAWLADWIKRGGATLAKPTHFELRDGKF